MSYQLYPQPYAEYLYIKVLLICTGRAFLNVRLAFFKTVCVPGFHKSQALQVAAALRRLARVCRGGINGAAAVWLRAIALYLRR
jgi:hypothetical protein